MKRFIFNTRFLLVCLPIILFIFSGCSGKKIQLINTELKVSNVVERHSNTYYRFDFETNIPLFELVKNVGLHTQVHFKFTKNGEQVFSDGAYAYSISANKLTLAKNIQGDHYTALFFKAFEFRLSETRFRKPIEELDFDYLEIQVVYPTMTPFYPYLFQSNITTYSRAYFLEQMSRERETLTIIE